MLIRTRNDLAARLEEQIAGGQLAAGELLPSERVIAEEYGLSRSMVREALRTLAERRLIEVVPGRGSFVRKRTVEDSIDQLSGLLDWREITARELIEARTMVEVTAASLAAERADTSMLDRIERALMAFDDAGSVIDQVRGDLAFHLAIVTAAGNPLVEIMFHAIQRYTVELMLRSLSDDTVVRESVPYHRKILAAVRSHDAAGAAEAMRRHLAVGLTTYGPDIDQNLELVTQRSLRRLTGRAMTMSELLDLSTK